jgi:hypothetical protein
LFNSTFTSNVRFGFELGSGSGSCRSCGSICGGSGSGRIFLDQSHFQYLSIVVMPVLSRLSSHLTDVSGYYHTSYRSVNL